MYKKSKNGILIILLIILLAIYFIVRFMDDGDRSFKDIVVSFDPGEVTGIIILDPGTGQKTKLAFIDMEWNVVMEDKCYPADSNVVKNILIQLSSLPTKRYAGKGEKIWDRYELTDGVALKISLLKDQQVIKDILIGKFSYNMPENQGQQMTGRQPQGDATTYVRVAGEEEVYAVDGFLRMNFNRDANAYRDRTMIRVNMHDVTRVVIEQAEGNIALVNNQGHWLVNGKPADSAKAVKYITGLSNLNSPYFVNQDFSGALASHIAEISGNNFMPVTISAFPVADTNINYAIHSSLNAESYFNGKKNGLFEKAFITEEDLLPGGE